MDDLAYGLMMQYEFNKAEEWYIKSLAIHEEQHDEWHTLVAVSLDHLSDLYMVRHQTALTTATTTGWYGDCSGD